MRGLKSEYCIFFCAGSEKVRIQRLNNIFATPDYENSKK